MHKLLRDALSLLTVMILSIITVSATTISDFSISVYSDHLVNLEFSKAKLEAQKVQNLDYQEDLLSLATILYYNGQEENPINYFNKDAVTGLHQNVIRKLGESYNNLYHDPNKTNFAQFYQAYQLAKSTKNEDLIRLSLMGLLEFFHFEYSLTDSQYLPYLEELKLMSRSTPERVWILLYELYFKSQSIFSDQRNAGTIIKKYDVLIGDLPQNHGLLPMYLSLKAYQLELAENYSEAETTHLEVLKLSKEKPFLRYLQFRTCIRLAEFYSKQGKFKKGLAMAEKSREFKDVSDTLRSEVYSLKYASLNNVGLQNFELAYEQLQQSNLLKNKLEYLENNLQNSSLEIQLQTAEKEKLLLLEQEENKRNRNIAYGLGGGVVAISLIGFLMFTNSRRKQRIAEQQSEIEIQKTEKILKEQELTTIDAMISGQEKERQRLASDLHDSVGATLAAAKLQFDHLSKNRDKPQQMEPLYDKTAKLLEDAYTEVRSLAHAKNSGVIAKNGLLPAVQQLARNASGTSTLQIEVEDFGLNERIENSLEISIFRMIQELVTNMIKHAEATSASISITQHDDSLNIILEDNGKGFDPKKVVDTDGMGLNSIERRIEHLEGTFEIDSTPGKGTTIIIDIPL